MTLQEAFYLAVSRQRAGELDEAESLFRQILEIEPRNPAYHYALFCVLYQAGRFEEALAALEGALELRPDEPIFLCMRGDVLSRLMRLSEAREAFTASLARQPENPETHFRLSHALLAEGKTAEAVASLRRAVAVRPDYPEAISNLAFILTQQGDLDEAIAVCNEGIARLPGFHPLYRNLGMACREAGRLDEAVVAYRRAISLSPNHHVHGDLLFTMHFHPGYDKVQLAAEHPAWYEMHAAPLSRDGFTPHPNDRSPDRRLRVGYVADGLGQSPLGRFLLPLLAKHNPDQVEVFCYCNRRLNDAVEAELMSHAAAWRVLAGRSDRAVAELIRQDGIDVLVDLNLHTSGNRLLAFALKPAPVQVTYLAYPGTTGLSAIDYRFTDAYLDPPGSDAGAYVEESVYLRSYWCYAAMPQALEVGPLPALTNGFVTFGCLNDYSKVTPAVRSLWTQVLRALPTSRLVLHAKPGSHRARAIEQFAAEGIDPGRLDLVGRQTMDKYFGVYNRIDIALDPFPWAGGTTTCDALYMGVPVVSLVSEKAVSRGGLSILSNIGLPQLAVTTGEQYVHSCQRLVSDLSALAELRQGLRQRIQTSPLMDAPSFARDVESQYRRMWHRWCLDASRR